MIWLRVVAALAVAQCVLGARILGLVPMPAKSHAILFDRLMIELANRGHQVTHISTFPQKKAIPNFREIIIPDAKELIRTEMQMDMFEMRHMTPLHNLVFLPLMGLTLCEKILELPQIHKVLNEKFDVIIGEAFLAESILGTFAQRTGGKVIGYGTFMPNIWATYMVGNPAPASHVPDPFLGYPPNMSFMQRVNNFLYGLLGEAYHTLYYMQRQDAIMRRHLPDAPPLADIVKNTSLVLVNHHYSLGFPRAYLPNMVEIGGVHVGPPKPLPQDLKKFMDESKNGVILFSLGSNLQSSEMSPEKIQAIMEAFSRMKQNVLWKFEKDELPGQPKNVKISKWLPQSDILAHPNLKLFITHGGLLSTTEAVMRGVPLVGIPIFGDQPMNMRHTEASGFGKAIAFDDLTADLLYNTVSEVLTNPKYKQAVTFKSKLLQDLPMTPLDTAVFWVEYVARHDGAPHLKSAAQDLSWYEFYLLDVLLALGVAAAVVITIELCILKCIARKLFGKKKASVHSTKKKN